AENTRHKITGTVKDRPIAVGVLAAGVIASMVNIDAKLGRKMKSHIPEGAVSGASKVQNAYYKNPLVFGVAALGIGTLVGMAFPPSHGGSEPLVDTTVSI